METCYLLWVYPPIGNKWVEGVYLHKVRGEAVIRLFREADTLDQRTGYSYVLQSKELDPKLAS